MKNNIIKILFAIGLAFSINVNTSLFKELTNFNALYSISVFNMSLCVIFAYILLKNKKIHKITKSKKVLSIILSIFMVLGEVYVTDGTFKILFSNIVTLLISLIKLGSFSYCFMGLFSILDEIVPKIKNNEIKPKNKYLNKYINLFKKYPFRTSFVSILVVWSIYLIAFYPIVLSPDPSFQIKQFFGEHTKYVDWVIQRDPNCMITAHHPVTQTFLLGWAIEFGRYVINDNFGLFTYTLIQTLIYTSILAYSIKFASKNGVNSKLRFILLIIYMFVPMFAFYSVSAVKDTLYTAFMMLFVLFVFDIIKNYKTKKIETSKLIGLYFIMLLIALFRHNGIYIIVMTLPFILLYNKKNLIRLLIPSVVFLASIYGFDNILVPSLGIADGSVREMLSIPFQQTARVAKEREESYSKEDKEAIDKLLNYDTLASRYKPELSDPVKNQYNKYATSEDLKNYFVVWAKNLITNLDIYCDATMNNIYGYFYPNAHNWYIYFKYDTRITENNLVDYHYINKTKGLREVLTSYGKIFPYIPFIGLLSNIAIGTWMIFILLVYLISTKNKKYIITLIPLLGSLLFCIVGPANTYFRYAMPYLFVIPVLSMLLLEVIRGEKNEKE